jgi:hypothetical protein
VTTTPLTGLLLASFTVTTSGAAKAALTVVDCGVPLVAVIEAGVREFVSAKLAGVATPGTAAETV